MNALYFNYKELLLTKQFNWLVDDIRVGLYDAPTIYDPLDTLIGDLLGTQIDPGSTLTSRSVANGFAIAGPTVYTNLTDPLIVAVAILYRFSDGSLIAYMDEVIGFTFLPVGNDYALTPGGPGGAFFQL